MNDRRQTGVNRAVAKNGDFDVYTVTANRIKVWAGALFAILGVIAVVFGAARAGVQIEVKDAIKVEAQDEGGVIHREIHGCVEEVVEEVQAVFQDDLDVFDEEQREQGKAIARIETKQIALEEKMDDDKEDLIREIRLAASGGG